MGWTRFHGQSDSRRKQSVSFDQRKVGVLQARYERFKGNVTQRKRPGLEQEMRVDRNTENGRKWTLNMLTTDET
ncbi:hypothetical protein BC567DRAFT_14066 [Phyllosticta citribraziliensis]